MRPVAPGSRIGSGRLRVDAARAIAKLREYQLAERTTWINEAVRAAVASSATSIELDGDSNDVWLSWTGPPWDPEVLPRLLDELVSPEPSRDAQHLRLLATAINSALGLDPAYIDLFSVAANGSARRVRYTPEVLELPATDDEEPAIRQLACESVDRPRRAPASGMHLHLRRRAGFETLGYMLRGESPELAIAHRSCRDLDVPIRVGQVRLGRDQFAGDLLRADLGGSLRGFLAVLDPGWATHTEPVAEMAERGVVITRYSIGTDIAAGRGPMPVRLFVDAPRMPTNASRSEVRRDGHPVKQAEARARELTGPLIEKLAGELSDPATDSARRARLCDAALAMLASAAAGIDWPHRLRSIRGPLGHIAGLELVKDATGFARPVNAHWTPSIVHTGREPLDAELRPWTKDVLWVPPGDPAARLVERADLDPAGLHERIKDARRQLKRRRRFYRGKERAPRVESSRGDWVHASVGAPLDGSGVDDARFEGVTGELALSRGSGPAEVVLMVDGRPLETVALISPIRFTAIVAHDELQPRPTYRAVHRNAAYTRCLNAATAAAVRAVEAVALAADGVLPPEGYRLGRRRPDDIDRVARLVRGGLHLAYKLAPGAVTGPMVRARAWPTVAGEWRSTAELRELEAFGTAPPGARISIAREIVLASPADRELLRAQVDAAPVHYDPTVLPETGDLAAKLASDLALGHVAALAIREPTRRGAIAWGVTGSLIEVFHAGAPVAELGLDHELTECHIAVDDDAIIPEPSWTGVTNPEVLSNVASAFERRMAREVARRFAGLVVKDLVMSRSLRLDRGAGLALCEAIVNAPIEPDELLGADVVEQLRTRPLFAALGILEPQSAESIAARFEGSIPAVLLPEKAVPGWFPLAVSIDVEAAAIGRLLGRETHLAADELARRQRTAERDRKIEIHRRQAPAPEIELPAGAVRFEEGPIDGWMQTSGLAGLEVTVRVERRLFASLSVDGPPISAVVNAPLDWADDKFVELAGGRREQILEAVRSRGAQLAWARLDRRPESLAEHQPTRALVSGLMRHAVLGAEDVGRLRALVAFETVQGGRASVADAESVGLARVGSWGGEWLGPVDGEEPGELDTPVLQVDPAAEGELYKLIDALAKEGAYDETPAIARLQVSRAMRRGLLSRPLVSGADDALKRDLESLGEAGAALGDGEIALVASNPRILVHELGVMVGHIDVEVSPPVRVAVEDPALVSAIGRQIRSSVVAGRVQRAAVALVDALLAGGVELPRWAELAIGGAALAGAVEPRLCGDRELFETTSLERRSWGALIEQAGRFGDVWYVSGETPHSPLDPERFVLLLEPDIARAAKAPFELVEATAELELDAAARVNRARPAVADLGLPRPVIASAIEIVNLEGDGVTAPRGMVAVLAPSASAVGRGVEIHRELKPLGRVDDPCDWPTYAVVDDVRLRPDRTWSAPESDDVLAAVLRAVQQASERALGSLTPTPVDVLASRPVWSLDAPRSAATARGRLWLGGRWDRGTIAVQCTAGEVLVHPTAVDGTPLPVSGKLLVHSTGRFDTSMIETLARARYAELVRAALLLDRAPHLLLAHAVVGLTTGLVPPEVFGDELEFDCFSPEPLDAETLQPLIELGAELPVVAKRSDRPDLAIVDDGSLASHLLIAALGGGTLDEASIDGAADLDPEPEPAFDIEPRHPLTGLAQVIANRLEGLGLRGYFLGRVTVMASMRALLSYRSGTLYLGGSSRELAAVEVARQASSPWAEAAIDAVVAHAVAELTDELVEVTPADQMDALEGMLS